MKKTYMTPSVEVVEIETAGVLCMSQVMDGTATEPAQAPLMDDDDDMINFIIGQ